MPITISLREFKAHPFNACSVHKNGERNAVWLQTKGIYSYRGTAGVWDTLKKLKTFQGYRETKVSGFLRLGTLGPLQGLTVEGQLKLSNQQFDFFR